MIIKKTFVRTKVEQFNRPVRYHYTGWFLLGLLPLYIVRVTLA